MDLKGKTVAIFGHGDQVMYAQNFVDAIGIMADLVTARGARLIGSHPIIGYSFDQSFAVRKNQFAGLVLDQENQPELSEKRIKGWVNKIKKHISS